MQNVIAQFNALAQGELRKLSWGFKASFEKNFDPDITYFILDTSLLDGPDVLSPEGSVDDSVIQLWDQYDYQDYSERVISIEWQREESVPSSVNLAMADIVLNNYDNYFTPNGGSPIEDYILPRRPVRILSGFAGNNVPQFVGLTDGMPLINESNKTVTFHCVDFLSYLFSRPLDETSLFINTTTTEIIDALFQMVGLSNDQYNLEVSFNSIDYAYFPKTMTLGEALNQLLQAEIGSLYMDEVGIIQFKNRQGRSLTPLLDMNESNIFEIETPHEDDIINVVEIKVDVQEVQDLQPVWQLSEIKGIQPGESIDVWADLQNPVVSINDPVIGFDEDNSYMLAFKGANPESESVGSGVNVTSSTTFAVSYKVTIENTNAFAVYIHTLELYGQPVKIINTLLERFEDAASVEKYDEKLLSIDNPLIQSQAVAASVGITILQYFSDYGRIVNLGFKGNPALQIGDAVSINARQVGDIFLLTKIQSRLLDNQYQQRIMAKKSFAASFFFLDESVLDGEDVLG